MKLKLGQVFWMQDVNEFGGVGRSDYECKVVGVKVCEFLNQPGFTDYLLEKTRLNSYHASFKTKESRTNKETLRYHPNTKELVYWHAQYWPGTVEEWREVKDKVFIKKPKTLRKGP